MKSKWLLMLILAIVFSGGTVAMAHGSGQMAPSTSKQNGNGSSESSMSGMDMSGSKMDGNMSGMDMSGKDKNMDMSGSKKAGKMAGMDMGEKPVKETQPNSKVLGAYGAVNATFIVFGIWNKWFRRKDGSNGDSK